MLFDDDRGSGVPEGTAKTASGPSLGGVPVGGDEDSLAASEAVGLHHERARYLVEIGVGRLHIGEDPGGGSRHPGPCHEVFGVGLRGLEPRSRSSGSECGDAGGVEGIYYAGGQRGLRADDNEVDSPLGGKRGHRFRVERVHIHRLAE